MEGSPAPVAPPPAVEIRFYPNHENLTVDRAEEAEMWWLTADAWATMEGTPRRQEALDALYGGRAVWVLEAPAVTVPCEGLAIVCEPEGLSTHGYQHMTATPADFPRLPSSIWHQMGDARSPVAYMLHLLRVAPERAGRDKATGMYYPYVVDRALILRRVTGTEA